MTMRHRPPSRGTRNPTPLLRILLAGLLGVAAALLVSCGSSGKGLIPVSDAGPLQGDFEAVAQEAQSGDGNCTGTDAALTKTELDFGALPATIDAGLRNTLRQGIANLRARALVLCAQPLAQSTATTTTAKTTTTTATTPTTTTPTVTQTTTTTTTPTTTTTTPTTTSPGGGTPAPGVGESAPGAGGGTGAGESGSGGAAGGGGASAGGAGASGQEGGK
jgi:uncharacterized membrane protein YgcG